MGNKKNEHAELLLLGGIISSGHCMQIFFPQIVSLEQENVGTKIHKPKPKHKYKRHSTHSGSIRLLSLRWVEFNCETDKNCDNGLFLLCQRAFPLWTLTGENERERGLTGWTTALDWEFARSDSFAAGKKLVTGSKVPSDLLQLKSGHSENLDFTHLFFVLHYSSSKYNSSMKRLDVS